MTKVTDIALQGLELTGIFVTYNMPEQLCVNVTQFISQFPRAPVIVIDNAPEKSNAITPCLQSRLVRLGPTVRYVPSTFNCRFNAYNMALERVNTPYIVFRTDDDEFDEKQTVKLLHSGWSKFAISPYIYQQELFHPIDHRHPLEIGIYETDWLKSFTPFSHTEGSDWALLNTMYQHHTPHMHNEIILRKVPHGRGV